MNSSVAVPGRDTETTAVPGLDTKNHRTTIRLEYAAKGLTSPPDHSGVLRTIAAETAASRKTAGTDRATSLYQKVGL